MLGASTTWVKKRMRSKYTGYLQVGYEAVSLSESPCMANRGKEYGRPSASTGAPDLSPDASNQWLSGANWGIDVGYLKWLVGFRGGRAELTLPEVTAPRQARRPVGSPVEHRFGDLGLAPGRSSITLRLWMAGSCRDDGAASGRGGESWAQSPSALRRMRGTLLGARCPRVQPTRHPERASLSCRLPQTARLPPDLSEGRYRRCG